MKSFKLIIIFVALVISSCEEFIETEPTTIITDDLVIIDEESAEQVLLGAYSSLQSGNAYSNLAITNPGVLSDELVHSGSFPTVRQMDVNDILSDNVTLQGYWGTYYAGIYITNVILERIENISIDPAKKDIIIGQAKYLRALMLFDLVKLYGAIPVPTNSSLTDLSVIERTPANETYAFIIAELLEAASLLDDVDYGEAGRDDEDRSRAGEWAAKALLARAYLYSGDKTNAGLVADDVIENGGYTLPALYSTVFNGNSTEAIFEVFSSVNDANGIAFQFRSDGRYEYAPSPELIGAFEVGDTRLGIIADPAGSKPEVGKYKDVATGTDRTIVSRLAEMYLIRAEANIGSASADDDLNILRARAGLADLTSVSLADVLQERFVELCFEGHRWNDLIRTNTVSQVMSVINPTTWDSNVDLLLPLPNREVLRNPNLVQNPGY
jgi:starch-binding outer membrane protein, SusD/RagB family